MGMNDLYPLTEAKQRVTKLAPITIGWRDDVPDTVDTLALVAVGEHGVPTDIVQGMWFGPEEGWMTRADAGDATADWEPIDPGSVMGWSPWPARSSLAGWKREADAA